MVPARTLTRPRVRAWALLAACLVLAACDRAPPPPRDTVDPAALQAFRTAHAAWAREYEASLKAPDGYPALVGLHWIGEGAHYVGNSPRNGIRIALGPAHLGMLDRRGTRVRFVPERGIALTLDGQPLRGATPLRDDRDPQGPSSIGFDDGQGAAWVIRRGDRLALRVRHEAAPSRTAFKGVAFWPVHPRWRVDGRFVPHAPGTTLPIDNIVGITDAVPNPGRVEFQLGAQALQLEALDHGGDTLQLIFADRTSGHGSYGAGRYLDIPRAGADGRVVVDFNRATNPPCAFTAFATCPLPPPANRLDARIEAGERDPKAARAAGSHPST